MRACCLVRRLSSCSLIMSNHLIFITILRHPVSKLLILPSICLRPFHDSHPYTSTARTMLLNSFSFVRKEIPLSFQARSRFLKAAPALPILISTSFHMSPSLHTSHPRYSNLSRFFMVSFSITTWLVSSDLIFISSVFCVFTPNQTKAASHITASVILLISCKSSA